MSTEEGHAFPQASLSKYLVAWPVNSGHTCADARRNDCDRGASRVSGGEERYFDWYNPTEVGREEKNRTIEAPLGHIPVYVRGRVVLACQGTRLTTRDARGTGWSVIFAPGVDGSSQRMVYLDERENLKPNAMKILNLKAMVLQLNVIMEGEYTGLDTILGNVTFLGLKSRPSSLAAVLNGKTVGNASYNEKSGTVFVGGTSGGLAEKAWSADWSLTVG